MMTVFDGLEMKPCYEDWHISDTECPCVPMLKPAGRGYVLIHFGEGDMSAVQERVTEKMDVRKEAQVG
jgi:hypothetical protein